MARPRSQEARQAALDATVDLLLASGVEGVTFDEVAARSGVAKTTLYRHFGSKQAMVVAAASSCFVELPTPDNGDLRRDLRTIFNRWQDKEKAPKVPDLMPVLLAGSDRDPELHTPRARHARRTSAPDPHGAPARAAAAARSTPTSTSTWPSRSSPAPSSSGGWSTARRSPTSSAMRCSSRSWRACGPPATALSNWHER